MVIPVALYLQKPVLTEKVYNLVTENCQITINKIVHEVVIMYGFMQAILRWFGHVPYHGKICLKTHDTQIEISPLQVARLAGMCQDPELMKKIIIGEESWIYGYNSKPNH